MKNNLLRVVQLYLDYVDGFQVESIWDSDESTAAAEIAEHVYYTIIDKNRDGIPTTRQLMKLYPSNDVDLPNVLRLPEELTRIYDSQIWYNGKQVRFVLPEQFLRILNPREDVSENTETVEYMGTPFVINNNIDPIYCTSFDDKNLVFDSYNSKEDTVLQSSKSSVIAHQHPVFLLEDTFQIPLPDRMQSGYVDVVINECCEALRDLRKPSVARRANAFLAKMQQSQKRVGDNRTTKKKYGRR